MDSNNQ